MKTDTYRYNHKPLQELIDFDKYKSKKNILIQIFAGEGRDTLENISKQIKIYLPHANCIGTTTDGEIDNEKVLTQNSIISISTFDKTTIKSSHVSLKNCFNNGKKLAEKLITENTKLFILFSDGTNSNGEEFLKGIHSVNPDITVAGGMAGDNGNIIQTYISEGDTILGRGAVGVSLNSDSLYIKNDFSFNWQSIGLEHTITKVKNNRVYKIDDINAVDFYIKYLGKEIGKRLPSTGIEFPLIIKKDSYKVARAVIAKHDDGSLSFAGNLSVDDKVKLGFGNAEFIMRDSLESLKKMYSYNVETFFIYSCMARRRYMPRFIDMEIKPFALNAPTTGFFTHGEFFHKVQKCELLNQSLTVVALSEKKIVKNSKKVVEKLSKENTDYATTIGALMHLVNKSTQEYALQAQKIQNLLQSQKLFLRYAIHEINTPLSVIMNNIELYELKHGKNPNLSNIEAAMKNLYGIYDDLSFLIRKDQIAYPNKIIELSDFIRSRIEFFEIVANQVNLQFKFEKPSYEIFIKINETKLQRIIDNNITNAIKYTKEHESIHVKLKEDEEYCILKISSRSFKIENIKKIFKPYYREVTNSKDGLGLGLNLVKQICDEQKIKISLVSTNKLTTFSYRFKRVKR